LIESSAYILFGLAVSGQLRVFLSPNAVSRHLGHGRFKSVFKAAFLGIPIPLCSCGVLPAAVSLRKQGANRGATTAFLISTPESGVDSIAISAVVFGMVIDQIYISLDLSARAMAGEAASFIPAWVEWAGAILLLILSIKPVYMSLKNRMGRLTAWRRRSGIRDGASSTQGSVDIPSCTSPT